MQSASFDAHRSARVAVLAALESLRPHQWLKNLLVFAPLLAAHGFGDAGRVFGAARAYVVFCLCASAIYLINDVRDFEADRAHPHKRSRAIASGRFSPLGALILAGALLVVALAVALTLPPMAALVPALYVAVMIAYTLRLKAVALLDVYVLAAGYALRVIGGGLASGIALSPLLLTFCMLVFLSLALLKRYGELALMKRHDGAHAHSRSYALEDQPFVLVVGVVSGALSVLVLALSLLEGDLTGHYRRVHLIWGTCVLLFYWLCHLWLNAHRGRMTDDPLVFALRDPVSLALLALMATTAGLAL